MTGPRVGTAAQLWRYPFKSMAGERVERLDVGADGVAGDRRFAVVDADGRVRGAKQYPELMRCEARLVAGGDVEVTLPDGTSLPAADAAAPLSALVGEPVTVRGADGPPLVDDAPVLLVTTASLEHLARLDPDAVMDLRRFRPNLLVATDPELTGPAETAWRGRRLQVGPAELRLTGSCPRCVMVTHGFDDVPQDRSIRATIDRELGGDVGVLAEVATPGRIQVGDAVILV